MYKEKSPCKYRAKLPCKYKANFIRKASSNFLVKGRFAGVTRNKILRPIRPTKKSYSEPWLEQGAIANTDLGAVAVVEEDVRLVNECYPSELAGNGPECTTCPSHQ